MSILKSTNSGLNAKLTVDVLLNDGFETDKSKSLLAFSESIFELYKKKYNQNTCTIVYTNNTFLFFHFKNHIELRTIRQFKLITNYYTLLTFGNPIEINNALEKIKREFNIPLQ